MLRPYESDEDSRDFTLYFDHQVKRGKMGAIFKNCQEMEYLIWSKERSDGVTIAWLQTKLRVTRTEVLEDYFPDATWVGTTDHHQKFACWFLHMDRQRWCYQGRYTARPYKTTMMTSGRAMVLEILATVKALRDDDSATDTEPDDDESVGVLQRTQPLAYPAW